MTHPPRLTRARLPRMGAIGRSLDMYFRDKERTARMDRLHHSLVAPGALVFDIGAHLGDRTASFLRLGARVVALEPQADVFRALRLLHGRRKGAVLLEQAVGAQPGILRLHINPRNPTVATLSADFIRAAAGARGWEGQVWDGTADVPVTTLDALIAQYGRPDFVKIDVEGHEAAVLHGLGQALPLLSFEFTAIQHTAALDCIARLETLGRYAFNYSIGEEHALQESRWLGPEAMRRALVGLPDTVNSGDIYARLC